MTGDRRDGGLAPEPEPETTAPEPEPETTAPEPETTAPAPEPPAPEPEPRPWIERIGMALVAAVLAALFGGVAVAAWIGGEGFLALMALIGALMTLWVGAMTLMRG